MEIIITIKVNGDEVSDVKVEQNKKENYSSKQNVSQYARYFDENCLAWTKDSETNRLFLKQQQDYANDLLKNRGYLFLNDVYDMLSIPRTKIGQVVGWIYDEDNPFGDNFVSFEINAPHNSKFMDGWI